MNQCLNAASLTQTHALIHPILLHYTSLTHQLSSLSVLAGINRQSIRVSATWTNTHAAPNFCLRSCFSLIVPVLSTEKKLQIKPRLWGHIRNHRWLKKLTQQSSTNGAGLLWPNSCVRWGDYSCINSCGWYFSLLITSLRARRFLFDISVLRHQFLCLQICPSGFVLFKNKLVLSWHCFKDLLFFGLFGFFFQKTNEKSVLQHWQRVRHCLGAAVSSHDLSVFGRVFIWKVATEAVVHPRFGVWGRTHEWTVTSSSPCC